MKLEVCVDKIDEVILANNYKVDRIELCSALELGGLTPSAGFIEEAVQYKNSEVHVMIRPRAGNFVYSNYEISLMKKDIVNVAKSGVKGVVFGALTTYNELDKTNINSLVSLAKSLGLEITFHRAIDFCYDYFDAAEFLISIGINRILTSGQKDTAIEGIENIARLVKYANNRIQVMAGSGVNENNVIPLSEKKIDALHFNIRKAKAQDNTFNMGLEFELDESKIKTITAIFRNI